jgi:hypothetical protein
LNRLYVSVRLHGLVVDERAMPLYDGLRLGESPRAELSFPGADVLLRCTEDEVWVRGRRLGPGDTLQMSLGAVHLCIEILDARPRWHHTLDRLGEVLGFRMPLPDLRVLFATVALAVGAAFVDASTSFLERSTTAHDDVQAVLVALGAPQARPQALEGPATPVRIPERDEDRPPAVYRPVEERVPTHDVPR